MLLSPAATGSALGGKLKVFTAWGTRYSQLHAYMSTLRTLAENRVTSARMKDADAGSNANVDTGHNLLKNLLGTLDDAMTLNPLRSGTATIPTAEDMERMLRQHCDVVRRALAEGHDLAPEVVRKNLCHVVEWYADPDTSLLGRIVDIAEAARDESTVFTLLKEDLPVRALRHADPSDEEPLIVAAATLAFSLLADCLEAVACDVVAAQGIFNEAAKVSGVGLQPARKKPRPVFTAAGQGYQTVTLFRSGIEPWPLPSSRVLP